MHVMYSWHINYTQIMNAFIACIVRQCDLFKYSYICTCICNTYRNMSCCLCKGDYGEKEIHRDEKNTHIKM